MVAYLAGRDERSWPDAERFDPDRFEDPTDHQRGLARQAWVPFGRGPHMWFGFALAQMELSIVLSQLVQALDITIVARTMPRPVGTWSIARPAASSCGDDVRFGAVDGRSNRWLNRCGTGRQPAEPRVAGGVSGAGYRPSGRGDEVPAHVHAGPCVAGDGAAAGPHYNSTGGAVVGPSTEVWLDFTVRPDGTALAVALVPFVVPPGARSIVIHAMARMPNGMAGARLACLPLQL